MTTLETYFEQLTTFRPQPFQQQTIAALLQGQDVLLRAPTGSGKTEAAIAPFLLAQAMGVAFPRKLIYVVPLRTLANSLRQRARPLIERWQIHFPEPRRLVVTLQTGENPEDPRFEGDIVFCTIDQLLSSFLQVPYSLGRGSANVNAGAIFAAYLVFDELHLLDPERAFTTLLELLRRVKGIARFLLMTATLTDDLAANIDGHWDQFIKVSVTELARLQQGRRRTFRAMLCPLSAATIWDDIIARDRQRVLIICNTVMQAQGLYHEMRELDQKNQLHLTLLHSRFLPDDRAQKEQYLQAEFGQGWSRTGQCHVLIATQVVEAGLNITSEVLHTQLCPMNALLQRAGRCARFAMETGEVYVYRSLAVGRIVAVYDEFEYETEVGVASTEGASEPRSFPPYSRDLCESTWAVLQAHTQAGLTEQPVDYGIESEWINRVHTLEDAQHWQRRQNDQAEFRKNFLTAFFHGQTEARQHLIRAIDSRSIYIADSGSAVFDGDAEVEIDPHKLTAFSVPLSMLCAIFQRLTEIERGINYIFKEIKVPRIKAETYSQPVCVPITSITQLKASFRILVNPRYAHYDAQVGLILNVDSSGAFRSPLRTVTTRRSEYAYRMDTYVGHLVLMWRCWREAFPLQPNIDNPKQWDAYGSVRSELLPIGRQLIQQQIFPDASSEEAEALFEVLVFLAVLMHDLGKLQGSWQRVMRGWQAIAHAQFGGRDPKQHLLAHTDYNPDEPEQKRALKAFEKTHRRPNHAVEGAFLAWELLDQSLAPLLETHFQATPDQVDGLMDVVLLAIGRHHSAWAGGWSTADVAKIRQLTLHPDASQAIRQSWRNLARFLPQTLNLPLVTLKEQIYPVTDMELTHFPNPEAEVYQHLYLLIVRALRLCDQRSVQLHR
ncbi:CRISPR-associated helicase Cas3' [Trichothermofontia sp.]